LRTRFLLTSLIAVALTVLFAACDDDDHMGGMNGMNASAPPGTVVVQLTNWAVEASQSSAQAGRITFRAVHPMSHMHAEGGRIHDLAVARKNADGSYDVLGQVKDIRMGRSKDLKLTLSPGEYELQCNVVEEVNGKMISHYIEGMRSAFTVS
jgi:hypothetical protein